ncbi:hypothetical protein Q6325_30475, partial [Klebsiella pneumoniae]|uniref:hypothetical protein n=1 Tax=Klebsiella pneumoniae TaxID=573 RepID=UPI00272FDAEA
QNLDAVGEYDHKRYGVGINVGYNPTRNSELSAGLWVKDESVTPVINDLSFQTAVDDTVGLKINYGIDTLEKTIAPR